MVVGKMELLQNHIWDLDDKITRCMDEITRHKAELMEIRNRLKKINTQLGKWSEKIRYCDIKPRLKFLELKPGGKLDNLKVKRIEKVDALNKNFQGKNYHYRIVTLKNEVFVINNEKLWDKIKGCIKREDISKGITLRIKRPRENTYYVWVKKCE